MVRVVTGKLSDSPSSQRVPSHGPSQHQCILADSRRSKVRYNLSSSAGLVTYMCMCMWYRMSSWTAQEVVTPTHIVLTWRAHTGSQPKATCICMTKLPVTLRPWQKFITSVILFVVPYSINKQVIWVLTWMMVVMLEPVEVERPCVSQGKTAAKWFALSRYTSQAKPPLLELSLQLSSAAQLSG